MWIFFISGTSKKCYVCEGDSEGAHSCNICGNIAHLQCGRSLTDANGDVIEGFGAKVTCNVCIVAQEKKGN